MSPAALLLRGLIAAYRWTVSPLLGVNCRFQPTCSEYASEAVARHGALRGGGLALRRVLRCHPLGGMGYDPVPARKRGSAPGRGSASGRAPAFGRAPEQSVPSSSTLFEKP